MYNPDPNGIVLVKVGSVWEILSDWSSFGIDDAEPEASQPAQSLDKSTPRGAASFGKPDLPDVTIPLAPPEMASPAMEAIRDAYWAGEDVELQGWFGTYREVGESTSGTSGPDVLIDAASREFRLSGSAGAGIPATFGSSDAQPGDFWRRNQFVSIGSVVYRLGHFVDSTKRRVNRVGTLASDIVTPDKTALADVTPATDAYKVHEWIARQTIRMRPTGGAGIGSDTSGLTAALSGTCVSPPVLDYAFKEADGY